VAYLRRPYGTHDERGKRRRRRRRPDRVGVCEARVGNGGPSTTHGRRRPVVRMRRPVSRMTIKNNNNWRLLHHAELHRWCCRWREFVAGQTLYNNTASSPLVVTYIKIVYIDIITLRGIIASSRYLNAVNNNILNNINV